MTNPNQAGGRGPENRLPVVAENGHLAAIFLSFLTTAGLFYVNIMPALISGLVEGLGMSQQTAGYIGSANVYGASVGALVSVFAIKYIRWKPAATIALFALISLDLISILQNSGDILVPLRFIHGVSGGFLVGIGFSVIARTATPDRVFGMLLVVQYGLGGVGLMFLPKLVPLYGTGVLFIALIGFSLVTLAMLPFLGAYPPKAVVPLTPAESGKPLIIYPLILALLAVFCFQGANMGVMAYVIELGKSYGLETGSISTTLGFANWISIIGAVLVYIHGLKYGRLIPLLIGLGLTLMGMGLFFFSADSRLFFAANVLTGITWAYLIPYLLGMCAAFDGKGQMAALSGFFSKMGLASGPFIAALIISDGAYNFIIFMAFAGISLCGLLAFIPARMLDKNSKTSAPA